jgi:hypothetical protein
VAGGSGEGRSGRGGVPVFWPCRNDSVRLCFGPARRPRPSQIKSPDNPMEVHTGLLGAPPGRELFNV